MASSSSAHESVLLVIVIALVAIGVTDARPGVHFHPCNTFVISSLSISSFRHPRLQLPLNPNPFNTDDDQNPSSRFFAVISEINTNEFHSQQPMELFVDRRLDNSRYANPFRFPRSIPARPSERPFVPFGVTNSLRERTKDILSVVVALLFGVGCGALTSATMYLVWSIVTNRYEVGRDADEDDDAFYHDDVSPKKMGYTMISSADASKVAAAAPPPPPAAKEVV